MDDALQNKIVVRSPVKYISQIEPNKMYVKSYLSQTKSKDGKAIYPLLISKSKEGVLFTIPGLAKNGVKCHMWLGSDIINIVNGNEKLILSEQSYAKEKASSMTSVQMVDLVLENMKQKKEIEKLKKELKSTSFAFQEQVNLRKEYQTHIATERSSQEVMKKQVLEYLFNEESRIYWFQLLPEDICGIYCLISNHEIVYIGQSVNIPSRIANHHQSGKIFDNVRFFRCKRSELDEKEMFLIQLIKPKLNGHYKNTKNPLIEEFKQV